MRKRLSKLLSFHGRSANNASSFNGYNDDSSLVFSKGQRVNVLAVGAHPDDIEFGCGGTLRMHVERGDKVYGLCLTRGEQGGHAPRGKEFERSARIIGFEDIDVLNFKDTGLRDDGKLVSEIRKHVYRWNVNVVFGHNPHDKHQDHRCASAAVSSAANTGTVAKVLMYESPSSTSDFNPHCFSDVTPQLPIKVRALEQYRSQIERGDSIFNIRWAEIAGMYWGLKNLRNEKSREVYMEAFEENHTFYY